MKIEKIDFSEKSYYELQNYQAAKVNSTKAIELDPNDAFGYYLRAWHNYKLGDSSNACRDINKAIELSPEDYNMYTELKSKLVCN
jgi:Tfp pilus assembly protein PilF